MPDVRVEVRNCRGIVDVEKERKKGIEASLAHGFHIEGIENQVRLIELQLQLEDFQRWWWQQSDVIKTLKRDQRLAKKTNMVKAPSLLSQKQEGTRVMQRNK